MPPSRKRNSELAEENVRLRARAAQLQDKLDHLTENGALPRSTDESDLYHRSVMSAVSDGVLISDSAGHLVYVSPNVHLIFGYSRDEVLKRGKVGFLIPSESVNLEEVAERGELANVEVAIRDSIGRARTLLVTVRQVDELAGNVMFVCRDVTERKKIELDNEILTLTLERRVEERTSELRESRERYRRLVEGLRDEYLFYASQPDGVITYISPSVYTILGYTPDDVIGRNWREFFDRADPSYRQLEELERKRFAGLPTSVYISPIPHASGGTRILEFRDVPLLDSDGRVIANEGIAKDVTQRHEAEEALRRAHEELEGRVAERTAELTAMYERLLESEHRYRSVVEDHLDFIMRWRESGEITFVNQSYCRYWNFECDQVVGQKFLPGILEEDREALDRELESLTPESPVVVHEVRVVASDGRVLWQRWSHRALFNNQNELVEFQSVGSDVTERRRREELAAERESARLQLQNLTEREQDVMRLVVAGNANKVIARKLDLSVKTIEKHRSSLMKKLRARSVPELVRLAMVAEDPHP